MPVRPLITTCVVDIGKANISTLTKIKAEHICVVPSAMKASLKLWTFSIGTVAVIVSFKVNRLMVSTPIDSKIDDITTSHNTVARF